MWPCGQRLALTALAALLLAAGIPAAALTAITDINPNQSSLDPTDPDGASGGRVNGLASVAGNNTTFYAASEWGGIYKTTNSGLNWTRLNAHLSTATWEVEVDPSNTQRVYATSFFDGRAANSLAGINVSTNGGTAWTHPASATPPANSATYTCPAARRSEPSAFGIGVRPDATGTVYVGTNCGVAISNDSGVTWTYVDPKRLTTPAAGGNAGNVWDVVVQSGGTVDVCGDDGHFRSTDGGTTWAGGAAGLPGGRCSIAVSPDEPYVLLVAAADNNLWESDNAGTTWTSRGSTGGSRIPFVVTNQRSNSGGTNRFDAWTGGVTLFRGGCTTPAAPAQGGAARCPLVSTWAGPFTRSVGAHDDVGDLVFDTQAANDACPEIFSSDGGVYYNTDNGADCQNPNWEQPNVTPHGLWLYTMAGVDRASDTGEDLYFGTQDNGSFGATDAGAVSPTWTNRDCCDVFDVIADANRVVYTLFSPFQMLLRGAGLAGGGQLPTNPPGTTPTFNFPDSIDQYGNNQYVAVTNTGAYITTDITTNPITWTQLGAASTPAGGFCGVQAAVTGGTPTFYAQTQCIGVFETSGAAQVWRFVGTGAGTWNRIDNNDGLSGGFGIFAVDPNNPNRLYASNLPGIAGPRMVFSTDGGTNWEVDTELDTMMTGTGTFLYQTTRGPTSFTSFNGYAQPSMLAYDQEDATIMVAGGRDSGIFLSTDSGANWSLLTDPVNAASKPHLPRPWYAYFDHEPANRVNIYVGTQGRGVWRIALGIPTVSAGGPYTTNEGQDVGLTATASDPDGQPLTYAWDFDNDGQFDDAAVSNPTFTLVGQDGVFPVRVKVTDPDGAFRVAQSTVTVLNVPPNIVSLGSDGPKPENSAITVTGTIADPGWLENLTATINWGDGTPTQSIAGTLENNRPNATLAFSVSHAYGDDSGGGTFTATVCGSDDDTTTCQILGLSITNVNPTAVIMEPGTFLVNGIPTVIAHAGETVSFKGESFDPGSDDRTTTWDWGDGAPSPDSTELSLNDPNFNPDPDPSPTVNPRTVTDDELHAFGEACFFTVTFGAADDDGGTASATVNVITTGNAPRRRGAGYWQTQYRPRPTALSEAQRLCYLAIAGYMSAVFNEVRDASTVAAAFDVLNLSHNHGSAIEQLDRQILTAWLNFANGAFDYTELVDTGGKGAAAIPFGTVMATAEAVRLNPASTEAELRAQRHILQRIHGS
jgi:PKD domain